MADRAAPTLPDRRSLRAARAAFAAGLAAPVRAALERALAARVLARLERPGILGSYAATGGEIDPAAIEAAALAAGWRLAFPRVTARGPLAFHLAALGELGPGFRGIAEPPADAPPARPDVLLVPLLAADREGHRIGQGGGHYDRTLASLRAAGPLLAIGLAWDMQLVDRLTPAPWDQRLDAVATPTAFHPAAAIATSRA